MSSYYFLLPVFFAMFIVIAMVVRTAINKFANIYEYTLFASYIEKPENTIEKIATIFGGVIAIITILGIVAFVRFLGTFTFI